MHGNKPNDIEVILFLMPEPTYIIGHRNPDVDAICSAIAYAAYKKATGHKGYQPARCGNSNARIDAILKRFKMPLPLFLGDVTPRVRDIMRTEVRKIKMGATCYQALDLIDRYDIRSLPVIDCNNKISGVISIFNLGEFFIPKPDEPRKMRHVHTSIQHIIKALDARVLNSVDAERIEDLYVRVGAMDIRSFGKWTSTEGTAPEESIIVVGDRYDIQQKAIGIGARLLVITGALEIEEEVVEAARNKGVTLIVSRFDSATTSWIIRTATQVDPMVDQKVTTFSPEEKLASVRRKITNTNTPLFCVEGDDGTLIGIFTRSDLLKPVMRQLILVDHNELDQAVSGAEEVEIVEVIDHHRLGNPQTHQPIFFRNEIIGSTSSIIAEMFRAAGIDPSPSIAGIMASGLMSDTLHLKSPTTTERDKVLLPWLCELAEISQDELADLIFKSGSVILSSTPEDVIRGDCKPYNEGEIKFSVSQIEELGFDNFWKNSESLEVALEAHRASEGLDFSCLLVTDINSQNSLLLVQGQEDFCENIPYPRIQNHSHIFDAPGIVSRKKQLIPFITNVLNGMGVSSDNA